MVWGGEKGIQTNINNLDQRRSKDIVEIFEKLIVMLVLRNFTFLFFFYKEFYRITSINKYFYVHTLS
jgi:hypothetical protein